MKPVLAERVSQSKPDVEVWAKIPSRADLERMGRSDIQGLALGLGFNPEPGSPAGDFVEILSRMGDLAREVLARRGE